MANSTLHTIKVQIRKIEAELPRFGQLIDLFEQRVQAVNASLPNDLDRQNPEFKAPLDDLTRCQQFLDEARQNHRAYTNKLARYQLMLTKAELELANANLD